MLKIQIFRINKLLAMFYFNRKIKSSAVPQDVSQAQKEQKYLWSTFTWTTLKVDCYNRGKGLISSQFNSRCIFTIHTTENADKDSGLCENNLVHFHVCPLFQHNCSLVK
uniref:Uncharacterized protein n=1 Tax=Sphaerodactylus townsendi TaxID=933632 RepID=A0ACB8F493_9SAUR